MAEELSERGKNALHMLEQFMLLINDVAYDVDSEKEDFFNKFGSFDMLLAFFKSF